MNQAAERQRAVGARQAAAATAAKRQRAGGVLGDEADMAVAAAGDMEASLSAVALWQGDHALPGADGGTGGTGSTAAFDEADMAVAAVGQRLARGETVEVATGSTLRSRFRFPPGHDADERGPLRAVSGDWG